ncbi:MAG TPA: cupin domain-containing protein [Sedimentisphaerales bacterium]|nr:cupin domain-containing protein [Sedimentisphaerales bacterium]
MSEVFPGPITDLPEADIPLDGLKAYLSQAENHQILFMEFSEDIEVPEHSHESQWGIVLEGKVDLTIDGVERTYSKGDRVFIPKGAKHSAKIYAGYADISFFNQKDRYKTKYITQMTVSVDWILRRDYGVQVGEDERAGLGGSSIYLSRGYCHRQRNILHRSS